MDWDKAYHAITKRNWIILFLLSLISYFAMPPSATLGVILGGVAIIINFDLLQYTIRRALSRAMFGSWVWGWSCTSR